MRDPLTGLLRWDAVSQVPVVADTVFLMIDLHGFKAVNDEHGQDVGDRVLAEVGRRISVAAGDWPAIRIGGDEFLVVARLSDEGAIEEVVGNLRDRIAEPIEDIRVGTWAAAGRATPGDTPQTLLRRTDRAMLAVTQNGWTELLIAPPDADEGTWFAHP